MRATPRVGILGGTFDPIHHGHLAAAEAARAALALDGIAVIPSHRPPHRTSQPHASAFHRFAMAALAISGRPAFALSDLELERDRPSYTSATLALLGERGLRSSQIFFITGADAFAEIATWYNYPAVLDLAHFVVVSRPGHRAASLRAVLPSLEDRMVDVGPAGARPAAEGDPRVFLLDAQTPDVSSTEIRRRCRAGEPVIGLVPPEVERYIMRQQLYAAAPSSPW
jgi:nicotinate-nucleotide adenylyltransferase